MGRTSFSGPVAGGYVVVPFTTGVSMTADSTHVWKVPFPCRVVHVSADCTSTTGGQYSVASTTGDIIALRTIPAAPEDAHGSAGADIDIDAVAAANRTLAEGESLTVLWDVGTNIVGGCIVVTLRVTGQPAEMLEIDD